MTHFNISRRKFISNGTIALSGFALAGLPSIAFGKYDQEVKIGLVGCGQRGAGVASIIKTLPGMDLIAYCDIVDAHLKPMKQYSKMGSPGFYKNYQEMLRNKDIDAVYIATPLNLHYQMVVDALDAGKHVYVEKTMTYSIPEALDLVNRMKGKDLVLQVGHQYRYYAMYHKIKQIIDDNWLGTVTHIESQYNRNSDWRRPIIDPKLERQVNWRMYREYSGGVMAELAAHQIDIVNWMLNDHPLSVVAMGGINFWKDGRETNDNVRAIYEYTNGVKSSVTSILSNQHNSYEIKVLGSKATLVIKRDSAMIYPEPVKKVLGIVDGVTGATIEAVKPGQGVPVVFHSPDGKNLDPTAYAFMSFADCIRNGKKPGSNVLTGRDTAIAVHMGNAAADTGNMQFWKPEYLKSNQ
ncbi:Gfo/Idh/MocA family protein [Pedobacter nyackensis]|uniref:Predicted dehydrogenase n=1 Tax=Pedobacter nyackensis TaxID=475255 RepID=A0A1W2EXF0_9SPHI|nr:Gfo/Idh/MocA family oxidoreductase [Pedobacter nyackensis]SMD14310.1 Predicted dehydrogenase [Pedobacter nyackensis]